jgi:hypothetical protein
MQWQSFEIIEVSDGAYRLPIVIRQSNSKLARLPGLFLMIVLAALIVVPQLGFAAYAFASSDVRGAMMTHPTVALELSVALAFWIGLIVWPLRNILIALISDRFVDIRDSEVRVLDRMAFSSSLWQMPLASFEGVALHVRSSLSGVRQEAVLVHPDRNRSVILMAAEHIGAKEIEELCQVLSLPAVPAARLYDFGDKHSRQQNAVAV